MTPTINMMAKPVGAQCNLNCVYCYYLEKEKLYPGEPSFWMMNEKVLEWIGQLPHQYKMVLTMYHVDSMSYQEIEAATGMPEGTVKNYLFRARQLLKEKVKVYLDKEEVV